MWELKEETLCPVVNFKILKLSKSYNASDRQCLLCTDEKIEILLSKHQFLLNNRKEIFNTCRHKARIKIGRLK